MKTLHIFDAHDYDNTWNCMKREAVRAIIFRDDKIALVKSGKEGYYKFPGGGIEENESHTDTIIRETLEETGLRIIPDTIHEFGSLIEKRKDRYHNAEIFEQHSYYYFAEIDDRKAKSNLSAYEAELDYHLEYADLEEAWKINIKMVNNYDSEFLHREAYIMGLLMKLKSSHYKKF